MPDGAGFPQPITPAERQAVAVYMTWLVGLSGDDDLKTQRLARIATWCVSK